MNEMDGSSNLPANESHQPMGEIVSSMDPGLVVQHLDLNYVQKSMQIN
uniref:Uncharacterized protein n=1 Tax=Nelumbo nucifera TaxID=4432 RepID=A0A822ZVW6_NELNU|nr:TPA_asm: hypothetical protein HUJ06_017402 [Nelumbo nucifera]